MTNLIMTAPYRNADGLNIFYGTDEAHQGRAGEYDLDGPLHITEVVIQDLTKIASAGGADSVLDYNTTIPKGARIDRVSIIAETAATSGGSATLDFGLIGTDLTTELDYNGFIAALAKTAYDAAGETNDITVGSTGAGALIGTTLTTNGLMTANYNTAIFTAGKLILRVYWRMPVTYS